MSPSWNPTLPISSTVLWSLRSLSTTWSITSATLWWPRNWIKSIGILGSINLECQSLSPSNLFLKMNMNYLSINWLYITIVTMTLWPKSVSNYARNGATGVPKVAPIQLHSLPKIWPLFHPPRSKSFSLSSYWASHSLWKQWKPCRSSTN